MIELLQNSDLTVLLITSLLAFIAWIVRGLVEKPLSESKATFTRFAEKRIEILTEMKSRLSFIAYFPKSEDSKPFKNQIQDLLLKDGRSGYLDKETFDSLLKISIDESTDQKLLLKTIDAINIDLTGQISKIQDEIRFYKQFSNYNPFKRFVGFTILAIQYVLSLFFVSALIGLLFWGMVSFGWLVKLALVLFSFLALLGINWRMNR